MDFNDWDVRRKGRVWSLEEFDRRAEQATEKMEFVDGIFNDDRERLTVLGMLLENLGIDQVVKFGKLADCKAANAQREKNERG